MGPEPKETDPDRSAGSAAAGDARAHAILVAAGRGERLGLPQPKGRVLLAGVPLFLHALRTLLDHPRIEDAILVVPPETSEIAAAVELIAEAIGGEARARVTVLGGGEVRRESVRFGLARLQERGVPGEALVLIHDAARPLLSPSLITRCLEAISARWRVNGQDALPGLEREDPSARLAVGVVPGLPVRETLKLVFEERIVLTQPRENLWSVQTPQLFRLGPLAQAHRRAALYALAATDDAALLEWQGLPVRMIPGDPSNLKITYAEDLVLAERLLGLAREPSTGEETK